MPAAGAPFWSAPKRFPRVVVFDPADASHASFVQAAAILKAEVYGIKRPDWAADAKKVAAETAKVEVRPPGLMARWPAHVLACLCRLQPMLAAD